MNLYRLLKVRPARNVDHEWSSGNRAAMFLLALLTGLPAVAGVLFRALLERSDGSVYDVVGHLKSPTGETARQARKLREWLEARATWGSIPASEFAALVPDVARFSFQQPDLPAARQARGGGTVPRPSATRGTSAR
jgi:hypothetical protein